MTKTREQRKQELVLPQKFSPQFWETADQRFGIVKEIRQRYKQLKQDAGADSFQKDMLCQRAIFIAVQLETMECIATESGKFDPGVYTQMANSLLGLLKTLGIQKQGAKANDIQAFLKERKRA